MVSLLPWRLAGGLGAVIGRLGYRPLGIRRRVVDRQLAASFPECAPPKLRHIARGSYANLGRVTLETAILSRMPPGAVLRWFHPPSGWAHVEAAMGAGRGLLLVSGHVGNWELGAAYIAARGVPLEVVARRINNPLLDRYLTRSRARLGAAVIPDRDAVRRLPRALRAGHAVALLADQGVKGLASTFVPFFGRLARTPRGPAVFALRFGVPCLLAVVVREPDGAYRMHFEPVPIADTGERERDVDTIVATYTRQLEEWVRRVPEQYLWQHRRWRRQPGGIADI